MELKERQIAKPKMTCGHSHHTGRCKAHGRPCIIGMDYSDGRQKALEAALEVEGVRQKFSHNEDSTHYCDICMKERREGRHPGYLGFDLLTQQILPTAVINKRLKDQQKKMTKRKNIADGKKKPFGNRGKK